MRRSLAIFIWILLGALAASLGIGSVLVKAKQERDVLAKQLLEEQAQTNELTKEHQQAIDEANRTILNALQTVSSTKELLALLTQEQADLEVAAPLTSSSQARRWPQTISFLLGVSIRTPSFALTTSTDTTIESATNGPDGQPMSWLFIKRYDAQQYQDLTNPLTNLEPVRYRLNQTLITGKRGTTSDGSVVFVLRTQRRGQLTHLIWARTNRTMSQDRLLDSLSTLLFATSE